jgi:hypothetical protein
VNLERKGWKPIFPASGNPEETHINALKQTLRQKNVLEIKGLVQLPEAGNTIYRH